MSKAKEMTKHNQCYFCKFRATIPGDAHTRCTHNFFESGLPHPQGDPHGRRNGWWFFPLNFDPVWHKSMCEAWKSKKGGG